MKISLVVTLFIIGLSICAGQTRTQDIVYLRNGSIIRGTIVELIPDSTVKIQTADSSLFVFAMAEVAKITKEQVSVTTIPEQVSQPGTGPDSTSVRSGSGLTLFGGASMPIGDFGSTMGQSAGAAKTGFAVGADGCLALGPAVAWMTSVEYSDNKFDMGAALGSLEMSGDATSWSSIWTLTGLRVYGNVSPQVQVFGFGQAGLLFGTSPRITLNAQGVQVTQSSASATAFAFGLGAGLTVSSLSFSFRYLSGEPEYSITASGGGMTASGKAKQPTSCILLTGGIAF